MSLRPTNRPCEACGAGRPHQELYRRWGYPILRCSECGLGSAVVPEGFDPLAIDRHPPGNRLLEVGSAYGFFLAEARAQFDVVEVEVSEGAVRHSRASGLEVHHGTLSKEMASRGPFDAVVMLDCIEHLSHPGETIRTLSEMMSDGAVLLITTGDWESPLARFAGRHWRLMTPPQHLFYSCRSISSMWSG
jgi:2-polyprenyl-3-methyl-5-hydroxy-6-metoxy-1,4-benzoquinol methylase